VQRKSSLLCLHLRVLAIDLMDVLICLKGRVPEFSDSHVCVLNGPVTSLFQPFESEFSPLWTRLGHRQPFLQKESQPVLVVFL
jgi:hypothetical protein